MNDPNPNAFDAANAGALCEASAAAYVERGGLSAHSTDTHVRITRTDDDLIIAFRGTTDLRNWLTDLDCACDLEDGCRVHRGFARALDSVQTQISAEIFAPSREGRRIWLTGHSLGGALAMLYAWRFFNAYHQLPFAGVYTFGQPRVGNSSFRDNYNSCPELFSGTFRVVHADDLIPRIPWLLGAYRHAGHEVFFTGGVGTIREMHRSAGANRGNRERVSLLAPLPSAEMIDASAFAKFPWDIRNAWRELRRGKLALLADHHVDTYLGLFQADALASSVRGQASETGRVCL